jgi:hypothetical protein
VIYYATLVVKAALITFIVWVLYELDKLHRER